MAKKIWLSGILLMSCVLGYSQIHTLTDNQQKVIYEMLKVYPDQTQVSFAFIEDGKVTFYGLKQEKDTLIFAENWKKNFEIGSVSKVFTCTLLANFVLEGKVKLDDPINRYIKVPLKDSIQITFKQLANHTSGLPRMPSNFTLSALKSPDNPFSHYEVKDLESYLSKDLKLDSKPGEKSVYSNLGVGLLGYVLCQIAGQDYESLESRYVFTKYDMSSTTIHREIVANQLIKGLSPKGKETPNWDFPALVGAGGILSTVVDLSKFALAQYDPANEELALTRVKTWLNPAGPDIGLAWHILKPGNGTEWVWHNGGTGGYTSSMGLDMSRKNAVIILSNISAFHPDARKIDELCFTLMKTLKQ